MYPAESKEVAEFLKKIQQEFQMGILLIEHDMRVVMEISDQIVVMDLGSVIAKGKAEEIRSNQRVIEAYLGSSWQERG
jgi:branched-chain amino acid transport system ATP-binding protein